MSRAIFKLWGIGERRRAAQAIMSCPIDSRVEIKAPQRSLPQNEKMWAMLTDVAQQKTHCGRRYNTETWKCLFMSALGREMVFVPSLDGQEVVPLGHRSSELSVAEMSELIEFISAWAAQNGVVFAEQQMEQVA